MEDGSKFRYSLECWIMKIDQIALRILIDSMIFMIGFLIALIVVGRVL